MNIMSSYAVEIRHVNKLFRQTIKIYNDAISYCIDKLDQHWNDIKLLNKLERIPYVEKLLHNTSTNKAIYDFDSKFPKMPSYLRHSAIQESIGVLSSYHTRLEQWELDPDDKNPPYLQKRLNLLPVFYKDNMYKDELSSNKAKLKVFVNGDWNWVTVYLKQTDIKYIQKHCTGKIKVPVLEHKNKKWFLRFAFDETVNLNKTRLEDQRILAVDLGINTDATCSIMTKSGAILGRKFINFSSDKDLINHALNKIKKIQQEYVHGIHQNWHMTVPER